MTEIPHEIETSSVRRPVDAGGPGAAAEAPNTGIAPQVAAERGETQDGRPSGHGAVAIDPTDVSLVAARAPSAELAAMQARFTSDLVDGLVGSRFNTYQHRARVLRQLSAEEAAR